MKVVSVVSRKGGSGKTTVATALAVMANSCGFGTVLMDTDPQASTCLWADNRTASTPTVVPAQAPRLAALLAQARDQQVDLVLIDTPPEADSIATEAAMQADYIIIPCRPSGLDIAAIGASVRVARSAAKPFAVVINSAPVNGTEVQEMRDVIGRAGVEIAPVVLHHRKAYSAQMALGKTAQETEPRGKAASEIKELFEWLQKKIDLNAASS